MKEIDVASKNVTFLEEFEIEPPVANIASSMLATDDCGDEDMYTFVLTLCADLAGDTSTLANVSSGVEESAPTIVMEPKPPPQPPPTMDTTVSKLLDSIYITNNNISALSTTSIPQATINQLSSPVDTEVVDSAEKSETSFLEDILQGMAGSAAEILDQPSPSAISDIYAGGAAEILDPSATPAISEIYAGGADEILESNIPPALNVNQARISDESMQTDDASIQSDSSGSCTIDSMDFNPPPGSLLYKCDQSPASPTNVIEFPLDTEIEDTPDDEYANEKLSVMVINGEVRICSVQPGKPGTYTENDQGGLADPGANVCMTNKKSLLYNLRPLENPFPVGVAVSQDSTSTSQSMCTHVGELPLPMTNGDTWYQLCYYNHSASDTFISPHAVCHNSKGLLKHWTMSASTPLGTGELRIESDSSLYTIRIPLHSRGGLYYCTSDTFLRENTPIQSVNMLESIFSDVQLIPDDLFEDHEAHINMVKSKTNKSKPPIPTTTEKQLEAELWSARLGFPSQWQMQVITEHASGLPPKFTPHPFAKHEAVEAATVKRQPIGHNPMHVEKRGQRYYMDFGFIRASADDYSRPNKEKDRVVQSFDGYNSYLIIVDEVSRYLWVFLTKSKEPPIGEVTTFLAQFGNADGGIIRTDQGGELARSEEFRKAVLTRQFDVEEKPYIVESTGADSPSQNGAVEIWNQHLANTVRILLYSAALPAQYWSAALLHAVYIHNRRVHTRLNVTPFEAWNGEKPNLKRLKLFGSRVCVKRTGHRRAKLDRHDFRGLFLGYSSTDANIRYLDLDTGIVKVSHHATFDEAWYTYIGKRPPAAQFLYDLGIQQDELATDLGLEKRDESIKDKFDFHADPTPAQLPMHRMPTRSTVTARAAKLDSKTPHSIIEEYGINRDDIAMIYLSPDPYNCAFEETIDLRRYKWNKANTAGMEFMVKDDRLHLASMTPSTPGAKIKRWRSHIKHAWLIKVDNVEVHTVEEVSAIFKTLAESERKDCKLLFSHPEIKHGLTNAGIPQISMDQLNNRHLLRPSHQDLLEYMPVLDESVLERVGGYYVNDPDCEEDVINLNTKVMKLTRSKLFKQDDWNEWEQSEALQLDQYEKQYMFGTPVHIDSIESIRENTFDLVWTYVEKILDKRKKARCTMNGSMKSGNVRVLGHTYANCIEHTGTRLFYAASAVENLIVFGSDVSNAFGEAPGPAQGAYLRPDRAFHNWWKKKGRTPIPHGFVIPVQRAMQGHPESPRLWEKHIDGILRKLGLTPTIHEPCLYEGTVDGHRILFLRQVDDFAIAAPDQRTADILLDMIDEELSMPIKRQGPVELFNGINVDQTKYYIKLHCETYVDRITVKHIAAWFNDAKLAKDRPLPFPTTGEFAKEFPATVGNPDEKHQAKLAKTMNCSYRNIVGELTYAMVTCRPDLSPALGRLAQHNAAPAEIHYKAAKHCMRYLYATRNNGLIFWRTEPRDDLPDKGAPEPVSNTHDLLPLGRSNHGPYDLHANTDSDWASCPRTRRSWTGICARLGGGSIGYKTRFQPTIALSSTEAEFMAACDAGKMLLYIRSILWDLKIPQESASYIYEDNNGATAMANAGKPTTRTRHMDIRYFALCDWVEQDLMLLERVDTSQNMADHFTKCLDRVAFYRHTDYIMGRVAPSYSPLYKPGYVTNAPAAAAAKLTIEYPDATTWIYCVQQQEIFGF